MTMRPRFPETFDNDRESFVDMPNDYKNGGIVMLIAGVINLMVAGLWLVSSLCLCVNSFATVATAFVEIGVGASIVFGGTKIKSAKVIPIVGLVGALLSLSMMGAGLEAFALILMGKPEVQEWLEEG